jgi:uncharacterized cupredoxin-like copper-binding protein
MENTEKALPYKKPRAMKKEEREKEVTHMIGDYLLTIKNAEPDKQATVIWKITEEIDYKIAKRIPGMVFVKQEILRFCKEDLKWKAPLRII